MNKPTKTTSIRIPIPLYERITNLAHKRMCSVNAWIVRTLEREAKPRGE